jgi:hyperosmotically inducible periplasmic protein
MRFFRFVFLACLAASVKSYSAIKADNSAVNARDKQANEYTAEQQGMSKEDTEITRRIRQSLMKDKSLSTYAQNVKIITVHGEVTLKGPVQTANEQNEIIRKAQSVAGVVSVFNQTDITTK